MRAVLVANALTGPVAGGRVPAAVADVSVPFLGVGSPRAPASSLPSEEPLGHRPAPQGHSQEPAVPRALHLCPAHLRAFLARWWGGPLGTALPVLTAGGLVPWGLAGSSGLLSASRAQQSHGGRVPKSGTQRPVHLPGQCCLLQGGGAAWRGWADPRGGRPL